jgi:hypothetical protein
MSDPSIATESDSDEVKVRLKHNDWEVEITCKEDKLKSVIENVLSGVDSTGIETPGIANELVELKRQIEELKSRLTSVESLPSSVNYSERRPSQRIGMTCRSLIDSLLSDNFFTEERQLGQIHEEISRRGYNYDRTAVSHSLTDMVRERTLVRVGTIRNYRYIQKEYISQDTNHQTL